MVAPRMRDPWAEITPGIVGSDNVRRADPEHPLDFRRGRDHGGRYVFSLEVAAPVEQLPKPPRLSEVDVVIEPAPGGSLLVLTLLDLTQSDIFRVLCRDLMNSTQHFERGDNVAGVSVVIERLRKWQELLRRRNDLLSDREVLGLAGELLFLRDCMLPRMTSLEAIVAWRGGHGEEQDFVIGPVIFEVKTQLSTADQSLHISSLSQLDTSTSPIFLCHQSLGMAPASMKDVFSLNGIIKQIFSQIEADPIAMEAFEVGLAGWRYTERPEYWEPTWLLGSRQLFEIGDGFPRLTHSSVPPGVAKAQYLIQMAACSSFIVDLGATMEGVLNG